MSPAISQKHGTGVADEHQTKTSSYTGFKNTQRARAYEDCRWLLSGALLGSDVNQGPPLVHTESLE